VVVLEAVPAGRYTYLRVEEGGSELWLATALKGIGKGETLRFDSWLEMTDFESKELKRTFETIYFIERFSNKTAPHGMGMGMGKQATGSSPMPKKLEITVEPAEGGITIGQLFARRKDYAGKTVKIRGQVVKFNPAIMEKNWVHLQDGTGAGKEFDLTVTTADAAKVGAVETFEGKITLNKDLGSGYKFAILMEDAKKLSEGGK
jgi:hypothetical protein